MYQGSYRSLKKLLPGGVVARKPRARRGGPDQCARFERPSRSTLRMATASAWSAFNGAGQDHAVEGFSRGSIFPTRGQIHSVGKIFLHARSDNRPQSGCDRPREHHLARPVHGRPPPRDAAPRMEEIATFTELGPYLDMPVRTYSAGMSVRLAFRRLDPAFPPEILLMDEWLSAGDDRFLEKARRANGGSHRRFPTSWCWPLTRCRCCASGAIAAYSWSRDGWSWMEASMTLFAAYQTTSGARPTAAKKAVRGRGAARSFDKYRGKISTVIGHLDFCPPATARPGPLSWRRGSFPQCWPFCRGCPACESGTLLQFLSPAARSSSDSG